MTILPDRQHCIALVNEALVSGDTLYKACSVIEVHHKTCFRWVNAGAVKSDGRPSAQRPELGNKLTIEEYDLIVSISNEEQYKALPPSQITP